MNGQVELTSIKILVSETKPVMYTFPPNPLYPSATQRPIMATMNQPLTPHPTLLSPEGPVYLY